MKVKTVLITGGSGAIGSNLNAGDRELKKLGWSSFSTICRSLRMEHSTLSNVLFVKGSVTDEVALKRVFALKPTSSITSRLSLPIRIQWTTRSAI